LSVVHVVGVIKVNFSNKVVSCLFLENTGPFSFPTTMSGSSRKRTSSQSEPRAARPQRSTQGQGGHATQLEITGEKVRHLKKIKESFTGEEDSGPNALAPPAKKPPAKKLRKKVGFILFAVLTLTMNCCRRQKQMCLHRLRRCLRRRRPVTSCLAVHSLFLPV